MSAILVIRFLTALLFAVAFWGMSKDWNQRSRHLTVVGKRQYVCYYALVIYLTTVVVVAILEDSPVVWMDWARLVLAAATAFTSNWRLGQEYRRVP